MKAHRLPKMSVEEYIQHEIETKQRHEYHQGNIYALAGGSLEHALLIGNIYAEMREGLKKRGADCKSITNDAKLHIESESRYVYPDSMVICGDVQKSSEYPEAVTNPILVVEVLSESTSEYDRGDKFYFYRQVPTLQEYVLIAQDRYLVETFYKSPEQDLWQISRFEGIDQQILLQSIGLEIHMKDLYFDIGLDL